MKKLTLIILLLVAFANFSYSQTTPKLVLPIGHTSPGNTVQFSPDGKIIVTSSWDNTAKIWDAESGALLNTLEGHTDPVYSASFSRNGKRIVTVSGDNTAKIWDTERGVLLKTLLGHSGWFVSASFSPDGKRIVTREEWDNTAKIWNSESGVLLFTLKGHKNEVLSAEFSPDGKRIVTASVDGTAKIWNSERGKLLKTLNSHSDGVNYAAYSPDGKSIVTATDEGTAQIWDSQSGALLRILEGFSGRFIKASYSPNGKRVITVTSNENALIWDSESGALLHSLEGHTEALNDAVFSPDGKRVITVSCDKTSKIWDTESGTLLHTLEGHNHWVKTASYSPDGKRIVTISNDETARIWNSETGALIHNLVSHTKYVVSASYRNDGKRIVTTLLGENIEVGISEMKVWVSEMKVWNSVSGALLYTLKGHNIVSAEYSPDGKRIITTASEDHTAYIWDAENGSLLLSLGGHKGWISSATYNPNGKRVVTASNDNTAKIWDAESGRLLHDLKGHTESVISASYSPDGKRVVTASRDNTAKIWDAESGRLLHDLKGHTESVISASYSPDEKRVVTASSDGTAKIWDAENGRSLHNLEGHTNGVSSAIYSPDGKRVVTASWDHTAKIWDAESGKLIKDIQLNGICYEVNFMNNTLITHNNSLLTLWDMETGKEIYSFLAVGDEDYLVIHPDGYYDGTEAAREYLYFTCGLEIIDLAQMKDALYVPGLVEKIMNGQDINYPKLSELEICGALPLVEQVEKSDGSYHYRITPRRLPLEYTEVYVNGKMVLNIPNNRLKKEGDVYILTLAANEVSKHFVAGQSNQVKVVGIVKQNGNILRSRGAVMAFEKVAESTVKPSLYALMVGVNDYKDPQLQLRFPAKDSRDLGNALELSASKLLGSDRVFMYHVNSEVKGTNGFSTPEREGIRRALEDIGRKAKPEDVVLIFMAGHGVMQGEEGKVFTFLTAEASNYNKIGITTKDLQNWLSYEGPHRMLANKSILIFDACNSGQATQELIAWARSDDDTRRIRQVEDLKDKSGMFILAASAPNQSAYELPQYEQGLLTYSLLHTLKNNPDVLDDSRFLNIQKWFLESEKYLQQLVKSLGYDQDAQPFGTANIRIGEVDETVKSSIKLAAQKPIVICANVLNTLTFSDDLQLKGLINQSLADISERGVDNPIFFARQETPNANSINILYQVDGEKVTCQVRLVKGSDQLHQAVVNGTKTDLNVLVKKIVDEVVRFAK